MENKDEIANLFKDKLTDFQAEVRPEIWNAVSSKLAVSHMAASTGISMTVKAIISTVAAAAILTGIVVFFNKDKEKESNTKKTSKKQTQIEQKITATKEELIQEHFVPTNNSQKEPNNSSERSVLDVSEQEKMAKTDEQIEQPINKKEPEIIREEALVTTEIIEPKADVYAKEPVPSSTTSENQNHTPEILKELPNVFTPNGDGANDLFELTSEGLTDFHVVILNDGNKVVFSSSNPEFEWDGSLMNGDPAPAGNYLYYLTAKDAQQNTITRSSILKLVR